MCIRDRNGLDPKAVRDVRELIVQKAQEGVTFLISSHILSELVKITNSIPVSYTHLTLPTKA
ncbi:hypothetical protein JMUB7542_27980 [Staphylococcus aureus]